MCYKSLRAPGLKSHMSRLKYIDAVCALTNFVFCEAACRCVCWHLDRTCVRACVSVMVYKPVWMHSIPFLYCAEHWGACVSVWVCWVHAETLNLCVIVLVVCVCIGSRLVLSLPRGLRAHFLLCSVISFPVRSSQHHYISDKLHC